VVTSGGKGGDEGTGSPMSPLWGCKERKGSPETRTSIRDTTTQEIGLNIDIWLLRKSLETVYVKGEKKKEIKLRQAVGPSLPKHLQRQKEMGPLSSSK